MALFFFFSFRVLCVFHARGYLFKEIIRKSSLLIDGNPTGGAIKRLEGQIKQSLNKHQPFVDGSSSMMD